jgi:hypothetical protein
VPVRSLLSQPLLPSFWPIRSWPPEMKAPLTSAKAAKVPAALSATMLLRTATWPPLATTPPGMDVAAWNLMLAGAGCHGTAVETQLK